MKLSRRDMLLTGLALLAHGCASGGGAASAPRVAPASFPSYGGYANQRPTTPWPDAVARPTPVVAKPVVAPPPPPAPAPVVAAPIVRAAPVAPAQPTLDAIPRSKWTRTAPISGKINPMNGVSRITIHHEGWTPVYFTDYASNAARLDHIRASHVGDRRWGDIGYHYVIDRAGRVWEGRNIRYQGAHVSECNEHNVGIMCLGNFDKQSPSDAQLATLRSTLAFLSRTYGVNTRRIYTHRELKPTACPGRQLQARVTSLRSSLA